MDKYLVLENGMTFKGKAFGSDKNVIAEVVFTTAMTGYIETLTDKSYTGQAVVQTFPLIGNYGIIPEDFESDIIGASAYIVREDCIHPSNFRCGGTLDGFLKERGVPGIYGIDTRALTRVLRENGVMNGAVTDNPDKVDLNELKAFRVTNPVKAVSTKESYVLSPENPSYNVIMLDFGLKQNICRCLTKRGCRVKVVPYSTTADEILAENPDGVFLSNGPEDPTDNTEVIENLKQLLPHKIPTMGICLGHQLLALLYIQEKKYDLAKKSLRNAGKIDANNTTTLRYLKEVNAGLRENNPKKQKNEDLISYQSGNETIIQPRYLKDNSAIGTIINMVIGIAIGAAITCFLIVPGVRREIQNQAKAEVLDANNAVASKNQSISSLEAQIEDLTSQITDAKNEEESSAGKVNTYEQLLQAYVAYTDGDIEKAGTALGNVNTDYLSDDSMTVYDTINAQVNAEYISAVYKEATDAYNAQEFTQAIEDYLKVIELDETYDNGNALYYLAQSYRRNDDMDNAKTYYQKFADLYPGTERAANAQRYLNTEE